jgi:hypothetical protein
MSKSSPPATPALKTISLGELFALDIPERTFLLDPWLREQESVLLWAAPGVGKTMFSLTLALAMAGGGEVFGWRAEPRRVLIYDGEMPLDDLKARLVQLKGTVSGFDAQAASENLRLVARHHQDARTAFPDFGNIDEHDDIVDRILAEKPDVVVLDNLSTLASIEDENGAAETQKLVRLLVKLKQAKVAVICIHHSNKAGTEFRGSSMMSTTFEAIIGLTKETTGVLDDNGGAAFKLEFRKFRGRGGAAVQTRVLTLEETDGVIKWTVQPPKDADLHALASLVRSGQYEKVSDILPALPSKFWPNASPPSLAWVYKRLDIADAKGILTKAERKAFFGAGKVEPDDADSSLNDDL